MASPLPPAVVRLLPCGCFYGWVIAAVLTGCQCVSHIGSLHLITLSVARIYATFETELGVEPSGSASLWMVGCGMAAVLTPWYGRAIDKWGGRICVPAALFTMAVGNLILTQITSRSTVPLFAAVVFILRSSAMGTLTPYTNTILSQWFFRRRGLAISVVEMVSMSVSTFIFAQLWQHGLDTIGWRATHGISALCAAAFVLPAGLLIYHTPESVGLLPDGAAPGDEASEGEDAALLSPSQEGQEGQKPEAVAAQRSVPYSFTRAEALRTASLYILVVDKMIATTVGVSCGSFLLLTMQENNAVGVSIATHVMIPCTPRRNLCVPPISSREWLRAGTGGIMQAGLPLLTGVLRDRGVEPRWLVGLASWQISLCAFLITRIRGPLGAVLYGLNCKCSRSLCVFFRSLKEAAVQLAPCGV